LINVNSLGRPRKTECNARKQLNGEAMKYQQFIINRMRFLNKRIFNRVTLKFAGSAFSPISIIRHLGRRSGTTYATPVIVEPVDDAFLFALPYGSHVDWYRNVLAAGQGTVIWHGKEYPVKNPESLVVRGDLPALPFILRLIVRIVGIQHFVQMKSSNVIA
jgi:deazaflavin-dependent oxidoreductase (nitroreductase family)